MEQALPADLLKDINARVFHHVGDKSAHSDIADALLKAVKPLGDVQSFCPDPFQYRYVLVSTKGVVFGFAVGMENIAFRLNSPYSDRALLTGGGRIAELDNEWVLFTLFRHDWPAVDLTFWARKAYVYVRETPEPPGNRSA